MEEWEIIQQEPVDFVEIAFKETLWQKQKDILYSLRDNRRTSVRSCHGIGKSFIAARAVLWFLYAFPNSKVITTAPSFRQVEDILWREIRMARSKSRVFLKGSFTQTKIDVGEDWFALGLSTDEPDRFQGFHAVNILLVIDEAAGVKEDIFEASEGVVSSEKARTLLLGNPTSTGGTFFQSFRLPSYNKISISAFDTPNFTANGITLEDIISGAWQDKVKVIPAPYLITPEWVADKYLRWGAGNPMWEARVLGTFPIQGDDTLIPLQYIEQAITREIEVKDTDPEQIGADIARFGVDKTVFITRKGPKTVEIQEYSHMDTMETSERLYDFSRFHPFGKLCVDVVGVGAGVVDRLRQLEDKREVCDINVGLPALDPERFFNLRAEIFWNLRERFINGDIQIPNDEDLMAQLANIKFEYTQKGQIKLESKDDMKKRGLPSPDKADALALAFGTFQSKPSILEYMQGLT